MEILWRKKLKPLLKYKTYTANYKPVVVDVFLSVNNQIEIFLEGERTAEQEATILMEANQKAQAAIQSKLLLG